jgi:hypothetical protein
MGRGAEKFLSLTPICCTESRTLPPTETKEKSVRKIWIIVSQFSK